MRERDSKIEVREKRAKKKAGERIKKQQEEYLLKLKMKKDEQELREKAAVKDQEAKKARLRSKVKGMLAEQAKIMNSEEMKRADDSEEEEPKKLSASEMAEFLERNKPTKKDKFAKITDMS